MIIFSYRLHKTSSVFNGPTVRVVFEMLRYYTKLCCFAQIAFPKTEHFVTVSLVLRKQNSDTDRVSPKVECSSGLITVEISVNCTDGVRTWNIQFSDSLIGLENLCDCTNSPRPDTIFSDVLETTQHQQPTWAPTPASESKLTLANLL